MASVSVGQIEILEETVWSLQRIYTSLEENCRTIIQQSELKVCECTVESTRSDALLAQAVTIETQKVAFFAEATATHVHAETELAGALATGNPLAIAAASAHVAETLANLQQASKECEIAKDHRMQIEQRNEMAQQCLDMATQLAETVQTECATRLASAAIHLETGQTRLESAKAALNAYLDTYPPAEKFYSWLKWTPAPNKVVTPKELHSRLNLSVEQQRYYFEYLADRDPAFRAKITDYRSQLEAANGPAERHVVQLKIRRNLSGYCGEKIVEQALSPLGHKTDTQAQTTFEDGRFTKTDLIIEDLKVPVILGRGEGMSAPAGGSIAIEVKCGRASYLYSQKDHMVFQSGGHQEANASMTVCSRDIKDLTPKQEEELREALRSAGSPLIGMLPTKDKIDKACWDMVTGSNVNNGGTHEN